MILNFLNDVEYFIVLYEIVVNGTTRYFREYLIYDFGFFKRSFYRSTENCWDLF